MNTGIVKFFSSSKGFGFITPESGEELFFHISEIQGREPRDGDKVKFEIGNGKKGPCAVQVQLAQ
ncbi:MAG: cold-shock protein [Bdellovibrionales bacterium]